MLAASWLSDSHPRLRRSTYFYLHGEAEWASCPDEEGGPELHGDDDDVVVVLVDV
jgi:hypothetical protein